jgi:hypothetical protein
VSAPRLTATPAGAVAPGDVFVSNYDVRYRVFARSFPGNGKIALHTECLSTGHARHWTVSDVTLLSVESAAIETIPCSDCNETGEIGLDVRCPACAGRGAVCETCSKRSSNGGCDCPVKVRGVVSARLMLGVDHLLRRFHVSRSVYRRDADGEVEYARRLCALLACPVESDEQAIEVAADLLYEVNPALRGLPVLRRKPRAA